VLRGSKAEHLLSPQLATAVQPLNEEDLVLGARLPEHIVVQPHRWRVRVICRCCEERHLGVGVVVESGTATCFFPAKLGAKKHNSTCQVRFFHSHEVRKSDLHTRVKWKKRFSYAKGEEKTRRRRCRVICAPVNAAACDSVRDSRRTLGGALLEQPSHISTSLLLHHRTPTKLVRAHTPLTRHTTVRTDPSTELPTQHTHTHTHTRAQATLTPHKTCQPCPRRRPPIPSTR
jgi:hypothetical protein